MGWKKGLLFLCEMFTWMKFKLVDLRVPECETVVLGGMNKWRCPTHFGGVLEKRLCYWSIDTGVISLAVFNRSFYLNVLSQNLCNLPYILLPHTQLRQVFCYNVKLLLLYVSTFVFKSKKSATSESLGTQSIVWQVTDQIHWQAMWGCCSTTAVALQNWNLLLLRIFLLVHSVLEQWRGTGGVLCSAEYWFLNSLCCHTQCWS